MQFTPLQEICVYYQPKKERQLVGRLIMQDQQVFFTYEKNFSLKGLELSPFKLPITEGKIPASCSHFDGLFGVFNDSLSDGWGCLLLDCYLTKNQINFSDLSPLDRLYFVGSHGMGALLYEPEVQHSSTTNTHSLDEIAAEIETFQKNQDSTYVEDLLDLGGCSLGARPKALLSVDQVDWLIKFPASSDLKDLSAIEYAYHQMAKCAGLDVPEAKLFPSRKGWGFFGTKRFDRIDGGRVHMHTISGLLHADHRLPSLDYEMILKATMHITKNIQECKKQLRACAFNVFSHNRDDLAKNFAFLMVSSGVWRVSPAYDLTFSYGPCGEHCTMVMREGKNPGKSHLLQLADKIGIARSDAVEIIDEVQSAVDAWPQFAKNAGVSKKSALQVQKALQSILLY